MRAIDADALMKDVRENSESYFADDFAEFWVNRQPTIHAEPHWIPCSEMLPEVGKSVLICDAYGDICLGHRTSSGYYFPDFCEDKIKDVRAWCDLPEPFKGVTE